MTRLLGFPLRDESKRIQLLGYYGMGNFGDDLFVDTLLKQARRFWPNGRATTFAPMRSSVYASIGATGKALRLVAMTAGALWADTFVYGGGSVFQNISGIPAVRHRFMGAKKFQALGVSIGPFQTDDDARRVSQALSHFDRVVVRDVASVHHYRRLLPDRPVPAMGGDLAGLSDLLSSSRTQPVITVCPSAAANVPRETLADQIYDAYRATNADGAPASLQLLALSSHPTRGDEALCTALSVTLARRGIPTRVQFYRELGLERTCDLLASSVAVWSQRLHGAIAAYLCGVPFLIVGHHSKCKDFAEDIGLPDVCLVAPDSSWSEAARLTVIAPPAPRMSPDDYRRRARDVYFI